VELATGRPVGVEALVRWRHPKAGAVPASTIVGIAERTGLIGALTFWIFNATLRQAAQWRELGITPRLAMNLSVATLTDRELPAVVDQSIKTWGVPAESVVLEIAENTLIVDAERSVAILTRLKGVGVQLSMDDFGSGFSSLGHLRRFPFDELKIDRPFVGAMLAQKEDFAVVKSAIDIAHNFGWRAVAEGVDPVPVREARREIGCDVAQGHAVSPALGGVAFREWWNNQPQGT
jgi:EAL domain-containing protein (putative c-di-GMP-specific phosphodiesterase class I)